MAWFAGAEARTDGASQAALLCALGVLPSAYPATLKYINAPIVNWSELHTAEICLALGLTL